MNLLFLTPQLPYPPRQGAALRNWGILCELAKQHEVHLLSFGEPDAPVPPGLASLTTVLPPSRRLSDRLRDLVVSREPDMARRLWSQGFAAALARLLATHAFEVVQVEGIEMVPYALPYLGGEGGPIWVYDAHNAETDLQRSAMLADWRKPKRWHAAAYSALQVWKLRRYEVSHLPKFDLVVAVSQTDARLLHDLSGAEPLVIPNGIDTRQVSPDCAQPAPEISQRAGPALVFTGKMDFRPNVDGLLWFVDEILPLIESDEAVTLWTVGQKPHRSLDRLRDHPQVVITGWVDAIEPYLAGADVVVVPLRMGSGTRLKVLQALSMARPLVGTTLGCAGLQLRDGEHLRLADDPSAFAKAISQTLPHPTHAAQMAQRARQHVQTHFDWGVLVPKLEQAFLEIIKSRPST
ncbi:MAG: glycosyltransferase [Ardenticatenaceae bacterium]